MASRTGINDKDISDIKSLVGILKINSIDEVLDKHFSKEFILPKTQYLLE